jgi:hypothetical protein
MRVKEISDRAERNPPPHVMSNLKIAHYAYRWSLIRLVEELPEAVNWPKMATSQTSP